MANMNLTIAAVLIISGGYNYYSKCDFVKMKKLFQNNFTYTGFIFRNKLYKIYAFV